MYRSRTVLILLLALALLLAAPVVAQEGTPASDADVALLNAATDRLFGADTIQIALDFALFIGLGGEEAATVLDLQVSGTIALDIVNEVGSAGLTLQQGVETQDIQAILDGDTLYLGSEGEWFGISLAGLFGAVPAAGADADAVLLQVSEKAEDQLHQRHRESGGSRSTCRPSSVACSTVSPP